MKNLAHFLWAALVIMALPAAAVAVEADMERADELLYEASGQALEYVYSGNRESKDAYLEKMKQVDEAITAYERSGDRNMAAVLRQRRRQMQKTAEVMFEGYESNDGELGLQARAFRDAADDLGDSMQEAIASEETGKGRPQEATPEQQQFMSDLMEYQAALRQAGASGAQYAGGGTEKDKQAFDNAMAKLDQLGGTLEEQAAKTGFDKDPRFKKMLRAMRQTKDDYAQAATRAFPKRESKGAADQASVDSFKQAEQNMLDALESE